MKDEPDSLPTARVEDRAEQQEQSGATTALDSGRASEKQGGQATEDKQLAPVQQSSETKYSAQSAIASAAPALKGKYIMPAAPPVARQPAKAPAVIVEVDSTGGVRHPAISRSSLAEVVSLSAESNRTIAKVGTTKAREVKDSTAEPGAAEAAEKASGGTAETAKEEALKEKAPADSAAAAEKNIEPTPKKPKAPGSNEWTVGVYFAPRYAFRKFVPNASDNILITKVNSANQLDPERMGFEFGTSISRKVASDFFVEGGLSWMQLKENVAYTLTNGKIDSFSVSEAADGSVVLQPLYQMEERQLISSYAYGGLRLGTTYYFMERGNSRLNVTVAGGANLLIKGRTKKYSNGEWTETVEFPSVENILEQSNYNLQLGVGYNASVLGNYEVTLMPTINYFLGSTFKEREPLGLKPYSLGLNLQLKRRFNR